MHEYGGGPAYPVNHISFYYLSILYCCISIDLIAPTRVLPFSRNALEDTQDLYLGIYFYAYLYVWRKPSRPSRYKISNKCRVGRLQQPHWSGYFYPSLLATLKQFYITMQSVAYHKLTLLNRENQSHPISWSRKPGKHRTRRNVGHM